MLVFSLTHSLWLWMMGICSLRCISEPVTWFDIRVTGRHGCVNYLIFHHARGYQSDWSVIIRGGGGGGGKGRVWWLQLWIAVS